MASSFILPTVAGRCRLPGGGERLRALLRERCFRPFEWGVHDCALFASDAVKEQVGVDPAAPLRGRYRDERQAARILRAYGGLEGVARQALGEPLHAPLLAVMGDVGIIDMDGRDTLAVNVGELWRVPGAHGLVLMPLRAARMAWKVGCA